MEISYTVDNTEEPPNTELFLLATKHTRRQRDYRLLRIDPVTIRIRITARRIRY
jgi:hypothetical protein